jgi:Skp family chaperone for outer membrane proteins
VKKRFGLYAVLGLGTMVAVVALYNTRRAQAQPPANPAAQPRIAFLNYAEVMKQYKKVEAIKALAKNREEPFLTKFKAKTKEIEAWTAELKTPGLDANKKEDLTKKIQLAQFDAQQIQQEARKVLTQFWADEMAKVYFEIYHKARTVAQMQGFECVFRYEEDWNRDEYNKPEKVVGRLQQPIWPLYYDKNTADITIQVYTQLNKDYNPSGTQP